MLNKLAHQLNGISETRMHRLRWIVLVGWLSLIILLFYDPISPFITQQKGGVPPFRIRSSDCVPFQDECLKIVSYSLGPTLFWGTIVPASIFILLVFGHEFWRRICPLSFISQLPRALDRQRKITTVNPKTGKTKEVLASVSPESWLGRNYTYLQFGLLFLGLCARLWLIDSHRIALGSWLILTIVAALCVGYAYSGKSWCQYICPMAPVQRIYSQPIGLMTRHASQSGSVSQSMCRTTTEDGKEKSACVACQSVCMDIDAERNYWELIDQNSEKFLRYGYFGLVIGFFSYYFIESGNWNFFFSSAWIRHQADLKELLESGLYCFGYAIPIPKLFAVPMVLGTTTLLGWRAGLGFERWYRKTKYRYSPNISPKVIQHRIFTFCTFLIFNFFFIFGGRGWIMQFPYPAQLAYQSLISLVSAIWLYRAWFRSPGLYLRESVANRLQQQLKRLYPQLTEYTEGRDLAELNPYEIYILAKVLPEFTKQKREQTYQSLLQELSQKPSQGYLADLMMQNFAKVLEISDEDHYSILKQKALERFPWREQKSGPKTNDLAKSSKSPKPPKPSNPKTSASPQSTQATQSTQPNQTIQSSQPPINPETTLQPLSSPSPQVPSLQSPQYHTPQYHSPVQGECHSLDQPEFSENAKLVE